MAIERRSSAVGSADKSTSLSSTILERSFERLPLVIGEAFDCHVIGARHRPGVPQRLSSDKGVSRSAFSGRSGWGHTATGYVPVALGREPYDPPVPQSQRLDQISDALSDGCPPSPALLAAGFDGVLALDTWNGWSAAFCMHIAGDGTWSSDIHFVRRDDSGAWEDCASGGAHGLTWPSDGWRPTVEANALGPGHRQGLTVPDDDGEEFLLAAVAGYAGSGVRTIRVEAHGEEQIATVQPQLSAFVIVRPVGVWTLMPLGADGEPVGEPQLIEPFT